MTDQTPPKPASRLGEIGLSNYAPYLMNRIMGRYNASLRDELAELAVDELVDATGIDEQRARDLILKARAHWFENESA